MLRRSSIDKYIRNATAGLPNRERIDTAAEMRVHLNQKTRDLMAQGFPKEEAEHLAVQEMGPVSSTNRALLGHMFTPKLGWITVGVLALGLVCLERHRLIWPDTSVRVVDFTLKEVAEFESLENVLLRQKLAFVLPKGTQSLEYATISTRSHSQFVLNDETIVEYFREPDGTRFPVTSSFKTDWSRPVEINLTIGQYSVTSDGMRERNLLIEFRSEPPGFGVKSYGPEVAYVPSKTSMSFKTKGPHLSKLELNKWILIETAIAEEINWQESTAALKGVQAIAIRANDRPVAQMPRSELRMKLKNNSWELIEKPRAGQRKVSHVDESMDESLRKEIEQRKAAKTRGERP